MGCRAMWSQMPSLSCLPALHAQLPQHALADATCPGPCHPIGAILNAMSPEWLISFLLIAIYV